MIASTRPRRGVSSTIESTVECPDCCRKIETVDVGEACCPDCNVVVELTPISRSGRPIHDYQDWQTKARCGRRSTFLRSDDGLGVGVTWEVRNWEKSKTDEEYRLDYAFGEIKRMASGLELARPEREEAGRLFRLCHDEGLLVGRSIEGVATACLLAAVRNSSRSQPVLISEVERVSRASSQQVQAARGAMVCFLEGVSIPPLRPKELAPRIASELDVPAPVRRLASDIMDAYSTADHGLSLSPRTVVGAALHAAYDLVDGGDRPDLATLAAAVDTSASTVSSRKSDVLECYEQTSSAAATIR